MNTANLKGFVVGSLTAVLVIILSWPVIASHNNNQTVDFETQNLHTTKVQTFGGGSPLVVPAAAFVPDGFIPDSHFFPFGGGYFQGTSDNDGCMVAPVYLPDQAEIIEMYASLYDNDSDRGVNVTLRRVDNFSGGTNSMGSATTSVANAFDGIQVINDITINVPIVTYPDYSYYLATCVGSANLRLYSVRLYYTVPSEVYLPIIIKSE